MKTTNALSSQKTVKKLTKMESALNVKMVTDSIGITSVSKLLLHPIIIIVSLTSTSTPTENGTQVGLPAAKNSVSNVVKATSLILHTNVLRFHKTVFRLMKTALAPNAPMDSS